MAPSDEGQRLHPQQSRRGLLLALFVSTTGFFHGYDNGVVNGVFEMPAFRSHMGWPPSNSQTSTVALQEGLTVNGFNAGAALSALLFGHFLVDKKGRRPALQVGSILFAIGGAIQAAAPTAGVLILGRVVAGVGVGLTSSAGTAFIAEVAPAQSRGAMVGLYQNNVCVAIVLAALLNFVGRDWEMGWRLSLGVQVAMGSCVAVGLCFAPETPRFLVKAGEVERARAVMRSLRTDEAAAAAEVEAVIAELAAEAHAGEATWREILWTCPAHRNAVLIGCGVQFAQIITGINALVSFSGGMFAQLGVEGVASALLPFVAFFAGNMLGAVVLIDRIGRRPVLIVGMAAMATSLVVAGIANLASAPTSAPVDGGGSGGGGGSGRLSIVCVVCYMLAFGASWGYGAWLYIPEIMPLRVRGKAVGLCTFINWGPANILSAFLTPWLLQPTVLGAGGTLGFFGCVAAAAVPFTVLCLPETRAMPLEHVQPMFAFEGFAGLGRFVRGNLSHGHGVRAPVATPHVITLTTVVACSSSQSHSQEPKEQRT